MAFIITDGCINCGYCEIECTHQAIYEPGMKWSLAEGTSFEGEVTLKNGQTVQADELQDPISDTFYFIVPEKCNECNDKEEPQCMAVCPDPDVIVRNLLGIEASQNGKNRQFQFNF